MSPVLEEHPLEAAKTNVLGTLNVVDAAAAVGTCPLSCRSRPDKAVHPSSVMGASKRLAEQTVLAHAPVGGAYCTVRFGNVLGSRGSVIPTFARQIAQGGPVHGHRPPDDPLLHERRGGRAAGAPVVGPVPRRRDLHARDGRAGQDHRPGRADDPAVGLPGRDRHPIEITGMRPGEKLNEVLSTPDEEILGTSHPYINRLVPTRAPSEVFASELEELELAHRAPRQGHRPDDALHGRHATRRDAHRAPRRVPWPHPPSIPAPPSSGPNWPRPRPSSTCRTPWPSTCGRGRPHAGPGMTDLRR